jgi:hypothetical protein
MESRSRSPHTPTKQKDCLAYTDNNFVDRFDLFSAQVSSFNVAGRQRVGSFIGLVFSLVLIGTVIVFSGYKFVHFLEKNGPVIS